MTDLEKECLKVLEVFRRLSPIQQEMIVKVLDCWLQENGESDITNCLREAVSMESV